MKYLVTHIVPRLIWGNSHPRNFSRDPVLVAPRPPTFPSVTICLACSQENNRRIGDLKNGALCPLLTAWGQVSWPPRPLLLHGDNNILCLQAGD